MPSLAAGKYFNDVNRVEILKNTALNPSLSAPDDHVQLYYHAALVLNVAAWNAYIGDIVKEFFSVTANPTQIEYDSIHVVVQKRAEAALKRFNTPNWENTRNILIQYTGYDPYNDWSWQHFNTTQVKEKLNEILLVRHSFAHGFDIPSYVWTRLPSGKTGLVEQEIIDIQIFFNTLVNKTDDGLKQYIENRWSGISLTW